MRNSWKVASWEIKRNLKNKSFLISIILTPLIFLIFASIGFFVGKIDGDNGNAQMVYVVDEINATEHWERVIEEQQLPITLELYDGAEQALRDLIEEEENAAYVVLDETTIHTQHVTIITGDSFTVPHYLLQSSLQIVLQMAKMDEMGLSSEQMAQLMTPFYIEQLALEDVKEAEAGIVKNEHDLIGQWVPGIVAGIILFSVVITGMMSFNSSMQEKKDKIAETLLSSISANDLMQGKIIGFFLLGLIQVGVWLIIGVPAAQLYFDIPVFTYLLVPELLLFVVYALAGYLLFSSMYVALGATIDDFTTAGNFQGFTMMLPFLPFPFLWAIISDPFGIVAQVGSYIPFTTSAVMITRIVVAQSIAWYEIVLSLGVLLVSVWLMIKLAGKIYRTGILMYGKNASPVEIWRWIRQQ